MISRSRWTEEPANEVRWGMRRKSYAWLLIAALLGFVSACGDSDSQPPGGTGGTPGTGGRGGAPGDGGAGGFGEGGSGGDTQPVGPLKITDVMPGVGGAVGSETIVIKGTGFYRSAPRREARRRTEALFGDSPS